MAQKTIFILSVSSDIGLDMAERYLAKGHRVVGTFRNPKHVSSLQGRSNCVLIKCDLSRPRDVARMAQQVKDLKIKWHVFISCAGHPLPVVPFFKSDFKEWADSVYVNSIAQLHALHALHPLRVKNRAHVVLFAGGGMNGAVVNFSAYTVSKIMLAKMCEFLDAENSDLNIFIVGPGWTKTKIHTTILADRRTSAAKVKETKVFMAEKEGTPLKDIFDCIEWLISSGRQVASGRNFSIVYDPWREPLRSQLVKALADDQEMYKIRRKGNHFLQQRG